MTRRANSIEAVLGLAAAWGAGVVVALALAAPAAADDADAGNSGPRAARSATVARTTAARPPTPSTRGTPARPAAAIVAAARSAAAVPVAARDRPPTRRPVAPGAAPAPSAAARCLFSCDPRGRLVTVYKGLHAGIPGSPAFFVKQVSGTGTFIPDSAYDLKDVDQYDWNKVTGIAFSPLQHDRNSALVGWRYNLTTQEFEIAPFYNVNTARILPDERTEVISVPAGETFQYTVDYSGVSISYNGRTMFKPYPPGLSPNVWTASRVSGWFGGNEAAPRTLSYYVKIA